jgi:hypothetical protein
MATAILMRVGFAVVVVVMVWLQEKERVRK